LLVKAFSGALVSQDPSDEPALALLERIRAARAAQPAKPKRELNGRKLKIIKMTEESVREAIRIFSKDKFSFDELHRSFPGDYESLKDIVFALLEESEPSFKQIFDRGAKVIVFERGSK
jgi:type I restriction enzyme S subunit